MTGICIIAAGKATMVAVSTLSLSWIHSVEKTEWREEWTLTPAGLVLAEARVRGSGAGMDPGEGAVLQQGWWIWRPELPPQQRIVLAASGATSRGWTVCGETGCREAGAVAGEPLEIAACP